MWPAVREHVIVPAAPGLENQCRAFTASFVPIDAQTLASLAANNPSDRREPARCLWSCATGKLRVPVEDGFDIGLAAAEGQTAPGPGKQRIHDSLTLEQRRQK